MVNKNNKNNNNSSNSLVFGQWRQTKKAKIQTRPTQTEYCRFTACATLIADVLKCLGTFCFFLNFFVQVFRDRLVNCPLLVSPNLFKAQTEL